MSSKIILSSEGGDQGHFAKATNKVVKEFRGKSRPFLMIVVEDDGNATVVSNMTNFGERIKLLEQTATGLLGQVGNAAH